jgi:hypothetical protein
MVSRTATKVEIRTESPTHADVPRHDIGYLKILGPGCHPLLHQRARQP